MPLPLLALVATHGAVSAAERSPAAARTVIQRYYAAIDRRDYAAAYALWDRGGAASRQTLSGFTRGFARTAHSRVVAGVPLDGEGAAGSVFITVPVRVEAVRTDGRRQRFAGTYVLRRVNDVDGASPEQLRWHISSATLRPIG